jgi:hypothetical protein
VVISAQGSEHVQERVRRLSRLLELVAKRYDVDARGAQRAPWPA